MTLTADEWNSKMAEVLETASYIPGDLVPPGDQPDLDPLGLKYVDRGPLAYVTNEALDALVHNGADRSVVIATIAERSGPEISVADVEAVLSGKEKCPDLSLISAFGSVLSIDTDTLVDAAQRGGCTKLGPPLAPPDV